jgi:hypothetical protein
MPWESGDVKLRHVAAKRAKKNPVDAMQRKSWWYRIGDDDLRRSIAGLERTLLGLAIFT